MTFLRCIRGLLGSNGVPKDFQRQIPDVLETVTDWYVAPVAVGNGTTAAVPMEISAALLLVGSTIGRQDRLNLVDTLGRYTPSSLTDGYTIATGGWDNTNRLTIKAATGHSPIVDMSLSQFRDGTSGTPLTAWTLMTVLAFASGTSEPALGSTTTGATSGATGTVRKVVLVSGTWGGGTAAGWLVLQPAAGTFVNESVTYATVTAQAANTTVYRSTSTVQTPSASARQVLAHIQLDGEYWPLCGVRVDDTSIWQTNERYNNGLTDRWYTGPMIMGSQDGYAYVRLNNSSAVEMNSKDTVSTVTTNPNQQNIRAYFSDARAFYLDGHDNITFDGIEFNECYMAVRSATSTESNITISNTTGRIGFFLTRMGSGSNWTIANNVSEGLLGKPRHWVAWSDVKGGYTQAEPIRKAWLQADTVSDVSIYGNTVTGFFDGFLTAGATNVEIGKYGSSKMDQAAAWANANTFSIMDDMWQMYIANIGADIHHNYFYGAGPSRDGAGTGDGTTQNVRIHHNIMDPGAYPIFLGRENSGVSGVLEGIGTAPTISSHGADSDSDALLTFGSNPANNDTVTVNGTVITFKSAGPVGNQVLIGATAALTRTALVTFVNASLSGVKAYADGSATAYFYDASYPSTSLITVASGTAAVTATAATNTNYRFPWIFAYNTLVYPSDSLVTSFTNLTNFSPTSFNSSGLGIYANNLMFIETAFMPLARDVLPLFSDQIVDGNYIGRVSVNAGTGAHYRQTKGSAGFSTSGANTVAAWVASSGFTDSQNYYAAGWDANTDEVAHATQAAVIDGDYAAVPVLAQTGSIDISAYGYDGLTTYEPHRGAIAP